MGSFRIVVEGVGGHGVQRDVPDGGTVDFAAEIGYSSEVVALRFVRDLKAIGVDVTKAEIQHWPADLGYEVDGPVDNLLTGARKGTFGE